MPLTMTLRMPRGCRYYDDFADAFTRAADAAYAAFRHATLLMLRRALRYATLLPPASSRR